MSVVQPTTVRCASNGSYNRHANLAAPGCGLPGGIGQYQTGGSAGWSTVNLFNGGTNRNLASYSAGEDIGPAMRQAFLDHWGSQTRIVIPEGDWTFNQVSFGDGIGGQHRGGFAFDGAGMRRTYLTKRSGGFSQVVCGGGSYWGNLPAGPGSGGYIVPTPMIQGQSTLTISAGNRSTWGFFVGTKLRFYWANMTDNALIAAGNCPVLQLRAQPYVRFQSAEITSISGDTVTFYPPILHAPHASLDCRMYAGEMSDACRRIGFENITFRTDVGVSTSTLVGLSEVSEAWFLNCEFSAPDGIQYGLQIESCNRFEVRGCYFHGAVGQGNNHAICLVGSCSSGLFEDNIFELSSTCLEINASTGIVLHANYFRGQVYINHGAHCFGILLIRNIFTFIISDGFHGTLEAVTSIGNWGYLYGMVFRRLTYFANSYGNIIGSTTANPAFETFDFINGHGIPFIGGGDPFLNTKPHYNMFAGNFPVDWPYGAPRFVKLLTAETPTMGIWEAQSPMYVSNQGSMSFCMLVGVDGYFLSGGYLDGIGVLPGSETQWRSPLLSGGLLPAEGSLHQLISPGPEGYPQHDDGVWATHDFRANFCINPFVSNFPSQPLAGGDSVWEPLGLTSGAPAGDGIDEINWGSCPWFTNGNQQHGFIDRSNPSGVTHSDIPAAKRWTDNAIFAPSTQVAMPTFSPAAGNFGTAQNIAILCSTVDAIIRFTIDGSEPGPGSPVYATPIACALPSTTTIKAYATKVGLDDSAVRTGVFTIAAVGGSQPIPTLRSVRAPLFAIPPS